MTKSMHLSSRKLLLAFAAFAAFALFATACGGGAGSGGSSETSSAAIAAAASNQPQLVLTDSVDSTQLLDTADGSIQQLTDVVTGDRPVLMWYWAPH